MMKPLTSIAASLISATTLLAASAAMAAGAPDLAKGKASFVTCAACHGANGNSAIAANPSLAQQHPEYLVKQLKEFKAGVRKNAIMNGMAAPLSADEMKALAQYFSKQTLKPAVAKDEKLATEGRALWRAGDMKKGIPACAGCHGVAGAGLPAQYPALAGQHQDYLISQLKQFRDGTRANDPEGMMRTIAAKMTDQQMAAVAEYAAGLRQ